jgi:hypothetical protein
MTTVGLHSGDGKSMVRKHLARAAAMAGLRVQEYVFEDPEELAADRTFSDLMDEDSLALRRLRLGGDVRSRIGAAVTEAGDWARRIAFITETLTAEQLYESVMDNWYGDGKDDPTRLVLVDYAQMFDGDSDSSKQREISDLAKLGIVVAKGDRGTGRGRCSFTVFSQVKTEVEARGRRWLESAKWNADKAGRPLDVAALYGFRPGAGDLQWSSALVHRSKILLYGFRPGRWARRMGVAGVLDNVLELYSDKENFGPDANTVTLSWDGSRGRIWDPKEER